MDADGEVLCHLSALDGDDTGALECLCELRERLVAVEVRAVLDPSGPGVDARDRVGRGTLSLHSQTHARTTH